MLISTPDWSALASENERVVARCPAALEVVAAAPPGGEPEPGRAAAGHAGTGHAGAGHRARRPHAPERRPLWRARAARPAAGPGHAAGSGGLADKSVLLQFER
jgi:hypothetical protein